jgi:hypothetical protein
VHGYLDYAAVVLLAVAPTLFGFSGTPAALCYVFTILHLGMSMMTAFPLGAVKLVPHTVHGGVELVVAILFVIAPWLFRFADVGAARNFFLILGVGLGAVWATTDYKAAVTRRFEREAERYRESFT